MRKHEYEINFLQFNYEYINQKYLKSNEFSKVYFVVDKNLQQFPYVAKLENAYFIDSQETRKNIDMYLEIQNFLYESNVDRQAIIVIIGGGVLLDVAGFAASTYNRGIAYINVPTTLLSMVDASFGGKTGINFHSKKNAIGNFSNPTEVIIDQTVLATLPPRQIINGMAEIIKMGLLLQDQLLTSLESLSPQAVNVIIDNPATNSDLRQLIKWSIAGKQKFIEQDYLDFGIRNNLNLGHTFGHAIEAFYDYEQYLHGEAVAIGLLLCSKYNRRVVNLLAKFKLPTQIPFDLNIAQIKKIMMSDKKASADLVKLILLDDNLQVQTKMVNIDQLDQYFPKKLQIEPRKLNGELEVNLSKSYLHRYLIACFVSSGVQIININKKRDFSDDIEATINMLNSIDPIITVTNQQIIIGQLNNERINCTKTVDAKCSASSYRMLLPILLILNGEISITADKQLQKRTMAIFDQMFLTNQTWPKLYTNNFKQYETDSQFVIPIDGSISSQFISGLLFACPLLPKPTIIEIEKQIASEPYLQMTIEILRKFQIKVEQINNTIIIAPNQVYVAPKFIEVEPDASNLSYFTCANLILGNQIKINNDLKTSVQADFYFKTIIADQISKVSIENCPDLLPTLCVYASIIPSGLTITNFERTKIKESNRLQAMIDNLRILGGDININDDQLIIKPVAYFKGGVVQTHGDHRIAFAMAIAATYATAPIIIDDYAVVNKSFPNFWNNYIQLGGEIHEHF